MEQNRGNYSIGLDIGTSSVGWAVINEEGKLKKKGNDPLWGYSLFEEGKTAAKRRSYRSARRRFTRRKQRIHLLQDLMSSVIYPIDPLFFKRMQNSYLQVDDRTGSFETGGILFGENKTDAHYYLEYPTIYHLRRSLMFSEKKADPRLIYLALHHIAKYRGNFLYEGQSFSAAGNDKKSIATLRNVLQTIELDSNLAEDIFSNVSDDTFTKKDRQKNVKLLISNSEEKKVIEEIAKCILGYKFNPGVITGIEYDKTFSFNDSNYEDNLEEFSAVSGDLIDVIYELNSVYSGLILKNILKDSESISESMILIYEKHREDLRQLKMLVKNDAELKKKALDNLYDAYINHPKSMPKEEFYKELRKVLEKLPDSKEKEEVLFKIENSVFLNRQNSVDNSAIPYQLHYEEAKKIIDKQKKYYPSLGENEDKILAIISFRRPYYLGPSFGGDCKNSWAWQVRKNPDSTEPIRPWNWNDILDVDETALRFIARMRNHCSYLLSEETLPKNSILLCRFNLLNELNKIKVGGKIIFEKKNEKIAVINGLFLKKNKVTKNNLEKWLIDNQIFTSGKYEITGFQGDNCFSSSLQSEITFRRIFGESFDFYLEDIERIIEFITIYNDKDIIERRIRNDVMIPISDEQIKQILKLNFKGYGRLSRKLIDGILDNDPVRGANTIIDYMYNTTQNFMQIINNSKYDFMRQISEENSGGTSAEFSYEEVKKLSTSPANKRAIWQSLRIVQDITKYMKCDPENIYIEFARNSEKKKRTISRYKKLEKIYKDKCDKEIYAELKEFEKNLDNEKVLLYFLQQGKCLYSGKRLDINSLNTYQVDHILPQSYIKDDSIENKALVYSLENQRKKDDLLLNPEIIRAQHAHWKHLLDLNLIGSKKYNNLIRNRVGKNEKAAFVARQLVETRQISIHVRDILKNALPNTEVGCVHAHLSSEFRHKNGFYKIRNLNSAHHANDAYLAALIGNFIKKEMPSLFKVGLMDEKYVETIFYHRLREEYEKNRAGAEKNLYSIIIQNMGNEVLNDANGVVYWEGGKQLEYIRRIFAVKSYFFNYQTRDYDGALYNATLLSPNQKKKGDALPSISIKQKMPVEKYGGYASVEKAFAMAVEYKKGKKTIREVIDIPLIYASDPVEFIKRETGDKDAKIIRKILFNQAFVKDGSLLTMSSASEWSIREPLFLDWKYINVLHDINKHKLDNWTDDELNDTFFTIVRKAYENIPTLQSVINSKIGGDGKNPLFETPKSLEYASALFNSLKKEEKGVAIQQLLTCITSKSHPEFKIGNEKISARFGRLSGKSLYLEDVSFVYTSPSGIYKTIVKL